MSKTDTTDGDTDLETPRDVPHDAFDLVGRDPGLGATERETNVTWNTDEDDAWFHTDEPAVIRRLLAHPHVTLVDITVYAGTTEKGAPKVEYYDTIEEACDRARSVEEGRISGLRGRMPIGLLTVKKKPRNRDTGSAAVTGTWQKSAKTDEGNEE